MIARICRNACYLLWGAWTTYTTLYWLMIMLDRETIFDVVLPSTLVVTLFSH